MENKYRTPDIKEFVPGFTCETNYVLLSNSGDWEEITFTEEILERYGDSIEMDAYLVEFRVKI